MHGTAATRIVGACLVAVMVLAACTSDDPPSTAPSPSPDAPTATSGPLRVRLAAGEPVAAAPAPTPVVAGDELDRGRIEQILSRLPDFATDETDRQDFNQPTASLRPPTVATTVDVAFPDPEDDPESPVDPGPVEVLRHQPDGDVDVAPFLSVTFNQDMIELGTLEQLDRAEVPVRVTPELPGRWRWIGARTLRYEHTATDAAIDRLPAATAYTVEVPAGATSVDGDELAEPYRWTFRTPTPTVTSLVPTGTSLPLEPVFVATFDQRVDPAAVLATVTLTADDEEQPLRLATPAEVDADDIARQATSQALEGRAVAFRATAPLPTDARLTIEVGPGTPSAEGPRTTDEAQRFTGKTYGEFRLVKEECGYGGPCRPGNPLSLTFSNPIDPATLDRDAIRISPELPDAGIQVYGEQLAVQGSTAANTTYRITVPGELADTFGQTLGDEVTATFKVGEALPQLHGFPHHLTTVDPHASPPAITVTSVGHDELRVRLFSVTPGDWRAYWDWLRTRRSDDLQDLPPWPVVVDRTIDTGAGSDGLPVETVVDLGDAIDGTNGHVVVAVESTQQHQRETEEWWNNRPAVTWAQVTSLGVDAFADNQRLVTWVTDLADGSPVANATVHAGSATATTDRDGLATTGLVSADHLVVSKGDDHAILGAGWFEGWRQRSGITDEIRWHVVDDRGLYRPGETLHLKGVVRRIRLADAAKVVAVGGQPTVRFEARDGLGVALGQGTAAVSAAGTFDLALEIPEGANLGHAWISLTLVGAPGPVNVAETGHQFRIDEFRRPAFEVATRVESPGPHVVTEPATVAVEASYFAGGPLGAAPVTWTVTHGETTYAPPNWPDFTFGEWVPWWFEPWGWEGSRGGALVADGGDVCCFPHPPTEEKVERFEASTDAGGTHYLAVDLEGDRPDQPVNVRANAAVTDVDSQQLAGTVDLLVHPARHYVGLRSDRTFVREGEALDIDLVVTTIDGDVVPGRDVTVTAARLEDRFEDGTYTEVEVDPQTCESTSADEPVSCSFEAEVAGRYRITAVVGDDDGGRQRTELTRWVAGAGAVPSRTLQQEQITIVPDQRTYEVGETAQLLVVAPFEAGHGLATVTRGDIVSTEVFAVTGGSAVLDVPITDALVGGADVHVTIDGSAQRLRDDGTTDESLPPRPAFAEGSIALAVPPLARTLAVTADPRDTAVEPGGSTTIDLSVVGPDGRPAAGSEVAVIVADEAVLSLIGRTLTDPAEVFHRALASNLRIDHVRGTIVLSRPAELTDVLNGQGTGGDGGTDGEMYAPLMPDSGPTADEDGGSARAGVDSATGGSAAGSPEAPITLRSNFDPLALFAPTVVTGEDGRASVEVTVPDSLTRYRVTAIAVHGEDRFGATEAALTARLPLMVRSSAPRFLNFGDRFEFRATLQNQTDADLEVDVVLEGANLGVEGAGANAGGRRVVVPAQDRVEVRFPATADAAGTARFRLAAVSGDLADASVGEMPVYTPVTTEAFATYGVLDGAGGGGDPDTVSAHRVLAPEGVVPQYGGLEITTSSTSLATLTDAVLYLESYRYESVDAHASRVLTIAALRDVLEAFAADGLGSRAQADATAQEDLDALVRLQNDSGGFGWWRRGEPSEPYLSVHAAHALIAGRDAGYRVPADAIERSLGYLRDIERHLRDDRWSSQNRTTVVAYALNVRDRAGDRDAARAQRLFAENDDLPLDALAWIWPVVDDPSVSSAIDRIVDNRVAETPGAATFTTSFDESAYLVLASDRRTDGLLLDALIALQPDSDLIPKVVNGLIGNQRKGHWRNVQENTFILLALKRYFDVYESATPDLVARVWLGDDYVAEHAYAGRTIDGQRSVVPMADLIAGGDRDLVVQDDGTGRLYYRLGLRYAPDDLELDARDEGFVVDRTYEPIDDDADVSRDADGTWHLRAGANVRVRVTMVADSARTNMALVDPLPAGLEAVNPTFATAPDIRADDREEVDGPAARTWWWWPWYDHQNLRDDRAEAFANYLPGGTYEYTYVARATTPGTFVVPPAKAEELYAPEVFGRSASDRVTVG